MAKKKKNTDTFNCPECGSKVLVNTEYCTKCDKKVENPNRKKDSVQEAIQNNDEIDVKEYFESADLQNAVALMAQEYGAEHDIKERSGRYIVSMDFGKVMDSREQTDFTGYAEVVLDSYGFVLDSADWSADKDRVNMVVI